MNEQAAGTHLPAVSRPRPTTWPVWLALLLAFLGTVNFAFGRMSLWPPAEGARINYWPIIFYNHTIWFLSSAVVPISLLGAALLLVRQRQWLIALLMFVGVGLCAFLAFGFLLGDTFEHLGTVQENETVYHLGEATDTDGFTRYALCRCDKLGMSCRCHYFYWTWLTALQEVHPPTVSVNPTSSEVVVQSSDLQLTYTYSDSSHCDANPDLGRCYDK